VMLRAARALAAFEQRAAVIEADVDAVAELALAHRRTVDAGAAAASRKPLTAPPAEASRPGASAAQHRAGPSAGASDGDWGALPAQPEPMARILSTGAWPAKKA
jgi:magnesium chelatase subunit I